MTTNAAAMPSLNVTTFIPFNVMRARKIKDPGFHNLKKRFLSLTFHTAKCCDRNIQICLTRFHCRILVACSNTA
jgi:hypothetical protein